MFDIEAVRMLMQEEVNRREKAREKMISYRPSGNKPLILFYDKRYQQSVNRLEGMEDVLYKMGYIVFINDENIVHIVRSDEIPF